VGGPTLQNASDRHAVTRDRFLTSPVASDDQSDARPGARVFISHSTRDHQVAGAICDALENVGISCWIAPRDVEPGKDWPSEIMKGLSASRLMVLVVSGSAQESADVARELERAVARGIPVVPFRIDGVALTQSFEYFLAKVHWLDAQSGPLEGHLRDVTEVVGRAIADGQRRPAGQLARARTLLGRATPGWAGMSTLQRRMRLKWVVVGVLVLSAVVLHYVHYPVDVTLHATTERVSFSLVGSDENITVLRGLPLTSLTLYGPPRLRLGVEEVREAGKTLVPAGADATLEATELTMRASEGLRLELLALPRGTRLTLYADREGQVILDVGQARGSRVQLGVLGRLSIVAKDVVLVGRHGERIVTAPGAVHQLEAKPLSRNPIFEPTAEGQLTLALGLSAQARRAGGEGPYLPFASHLKIDALDFTRAEGGRELPAIRQLWVDPLLPRDRVREKVYLRVPKDEVFYIESVRLSGDALVTDMTGRPAQLEVGKVGRGDNLVPSVLEYLLDHVVFRTVCKPIGLC